MTTPVEKVTVECSDCGHRYEDYHRRSMNLSLDDFDDDYLEQMSTTTCPKCAMKRSIGSLFVREVDNTWVFEVSATMLSTRGVQVPLPTPQECRSASTGSWSMLGG